MKMLTSARVADALAYAIPHLASVLPDDILAGLLAAREMETSDRARIVLDQLIDNAHIAAEDGVPICQDTGMVWVCLEVGPDVMVPGNVFSQINSTVAQAYEDACLRKSVVRDALFDRSNTGTNAPAFPEIHMVEEPGVARLHVMLKGGGSDNASRVVMLTPSDGIQGVIDTVLACVREKAPNACPPLIIGVGVGATFDKVGGLAKHALMRPLGQVHPDPQIAELETRLLLAVNATGIGAGALGGSTTALGVRVQTAPCHIAALPVAVNMGCSAMRRMTINLADTCVEVSDGAVVTDTSCSSGSVMNASSCPTSGVSALQGKGMCYE